MPRYRVKFYNKDGDPYRVLEETINARGLVHAHSLAKEHAKKIQPIPKISSIKEF